ncbi:MAG: DUF4177 domain-containing protein [Verrucomicrobiaceae bacterium]|nr:DUF4177 domain-containing protein [Verrucomicrobiaceae bacterium]
MATFGIREGMLNKLNLREEEIKTFLADAGANGWELVAVTPIDGQHNGGTQVLMVTLKRPKAA